MEVRREGWSPGSPRVDPELRSETLRDTVDVTEGASPVEGTLLTSFCAIRLSLMRSL
jgi:hypothetical protein